MNDQPPASATGDQASEPSLPDFPTDPAQAEPALPVQSFVLPRPFSVVHRDAWRVIGRAPTSLLLFPVTAWFVIEIVKELFPEHFLLMVSFVYFHRLVNIYSVMALVTSQQILFVYFRWLVDIYMFLTVFTALQKLAHRHRLNSEAIAASIRQAAVKKAVAKVIWRAYRVPMVAGMLVAFGITMLLRASFDKDTLIGIVVLAEAPIAVLLVERWLRYAFSGPAVIFEGVDPAEGLRRSQQYVRGNRRRLLFFTLGLFFLYLPFLIGTYLLFSRKGTSSAAALSRAIIAIPSTILFGSLWTVFNGLLYIDCRNQKSPWFASEPVGPPPTKKLPTAIRRSRLCLALAAAISFGVLLIGLITESIRGGIGLWTLIFGGFLFGYTPDCQQDPAACAAACGVDNLAACTNLGKAYVNQQLPSSELAKAAHFLSKACDGGVPTACGTLGLLYDQGRGVPKDAGRAAKYYRTACDHEEWFSCLNLGALHYNKELPSSDISLAASLFQKVCSHSEPLGCSHLGVLYRDSEGGNRNLELALANFHKACALGSAAGCNDAGVIYYSGDGVAVDFPRALTLFQQSCEGGFLVGCRNAGVSHDNGKGTQASTKQAIVYFRRGCDGSDATSCFYLAQKYVSGAEGSPADAVKQVRPLLQKACESGYHQACAALESSP